MFKKTLICLLAFALIFTMIPTVAFATDSTEMSEEFKAILNEDGELELNCAPPINDMEAYYMCNELLTDMTNYKFRLDSSTFSDDYSSVEVVFSSNENDLDYEEKHVVNVKYNYDPYIDELIDSCDDNITENYIITDLEIINYLINDGEKKDITLFSSKFRECFDYNDISFNIRTVAEYGYPLYIWDLGYGKVSYNGIQYAVYETTKAYGHFVLYVPDETEDTADAYLQAAQERINQYLGDDSLVNLSYVGTIKDVWPKAVHDYLLSIKPDPETFEEWFNTSIVDKLDIYLDRVTNALGVDDNVSMYKATINDKSYDFLIIKDSSKMLNPKFISKNIEYDVEVSTDDSKVPLDSVVEVSVIDSGEEFDRITSVLNLDYCELYDLKLYSRGSQEYITVLEEGQFLIKIPISSELEEKDLVVYYVDSNNNVTEHEVTVVDGYATFETNHFSIYTLAEKAVVEDTTPNEDEDVPSAEDNDIPLTEDNDVSEQNDPAEEKPETDVPPTGDNNSLILWGIVALTSLVAAIALRKREE